MEPSHAESPFADKVISPFAETESLASKGKSRFHLYFVFGGLGVLLIAIGSFFIMRYLNDPFRALEVFPISSYLDGYQALSGSKYRADMRVEADLGWKEGVGRLMLFSTPDDSRPIAVLVPAELSKGLYFTKGQTYTVEIEVKEGGLIYADLCRKN